MAGAYSLYVSITAGVGGLVSGLRTAGGQVRAFGGQVTRLNGDLNALAARSERTRRAMATGFATTGLLIGGALALGAKNAIELEKHMANVMTISKQINSTNIEAFTDQIVRLSTELPQTASQLAEGLYQIVSTGFDGADAMTILRVAAKGASAGLTDTETAARALLGVLKAYGMDASQASDVMDIMFQTVNFGVISFSELAQQLGDVVPMAAAAGVKFDDLSSALAAITLAGTPAAESATALNMLMTRMMKPTQELSDLFKEMGYESAASALQQDGLYVVMQKIRDATGGTAETIVPLLRDIRAVRAALALGAAEGDNYAATYAGISMEINRAQATQKAYDIQLDTTSGQWQIFRNQATALGIDLARALLPALQTLGEYLGVLAGAINDLPGPVKSLAGGLMALMAVGLLTKAAFMKFGAQLTIFRTELAAARAGGSMLPAVLSGTGIAVAGLTALMAIGIGIYAAYSASKQKAKAATEQLVDALRSEREEGEQGAGLRKLTEQLTDSDDVKKLKTAGVDIAEALDAITSGGEKFKRLKGDLDQQASDFRNMAGFKATYLEDAADVLSKQHKMWDSAVRQESELANNMAIVNSKIATNRKQLAGAWDITQMLPTDKKGAVQFSDEMEAMGKALRAIVDPAKAWKDAQDNVAEANRKAGRSADASKAKLADYVAELRKQLVAQRDFQKNLGVLASQGRLDLADHFSTLGVDSAPILAELVTQLKKGKGKVADELQNIITESAARSTPAFRAGLEQLPAIAAKYGQMTADAWADAAATNDPGKLARVLQQMTVTDLSTAAKKLPQALEGQMRQGMNVLTTVSERFGKEQSQALAHAFLTGDLAGVRDQLAFMFGADQPIPAPELAAVVTAFQTAGKQSNAEWSGMLDLITVVAQKKGSAAAQALTAALLSGDMAAVKAQLDGIGASVQRIPGEKTITVTVNRPASVTIPFFARLQPIPGDKDGNGIPDMVQARASGAVVDYFARGGVRREEHVAQIAPGGSWRVWAEPETQGEAYIPLAASKRTRSRAIAEETVRRLGGHAQWYASGGLSGVSYKPQQLFTLSGVASDARDSKGNFDLSAFGRKLHTSVATARRWRSDLATVARRAGQDVSDALADMGEDGIALTRKMATGSGSYVRQMAADLRGLAAASKASLGTFTGQLKKAVQDQTAFEKNLATLASTGYSDLAKLLAEQGDQDAADLADQAVRDRRTASSANAAARAANGVVQGQDLPDLVAIISAVTSGKVGLHQVADSTGLSEDHIIEIANLALTRIRAALGSKGTRFLADLARANKGLSYANGGVLTPGLYASAGGIVKFAEPETHGEAYIPLGAAKRRNATAVLQDVAGRFGYQLTAGGASAPLRLVDARPGGGVKVVVVREQARSLVENMPITVTGSSRDSSAQQLGGEIMRHLRNAQRGGRI